MNPETAQVLFRGMIQEGTCPFCRSKNSLHKQPTLDKTQLWKCAECGIKLLGGAP